MPEFNPTDKTNSITLLEDFIGNVSTVALYHTILTSTPIKEMGEAFPFGVDSKRIGKGLEKIVMEGLHLLYSPAHYSKGVAYNMLGFGSVNAEMKGNSGMYSPLNSSFEKGYMNPLKNALPLIHLIRMLMK